MINFILFHTIRAKGLGCKDSFYTFTRTYKIVTFMKTPIILLLFSFSSAFSQLDESKDVIDSRLVSTNVIPKKIGIYHEEIKLSNKTFDTIKVWYSSQNVAKFISINNKKEGFDNEAFHRLSSHLNIGFNLTNSLNIANQEFFYDSKIRRLIIKIYSSQLKNKLVEVQFISDYELIKNKLPQVINW
jgi:hypothetical protein